MTVFNLHISIVRTMVCWCKEDGSSNLPVKPFFVGVGMLNVAWSNFSWKTLSSPDRQSRAELWGISLNEGLQLTVVGRVDMPDTHYLEVKPINLMPPASWANYCTETVQWLVYNWTLVSGTVIRQSVYRHRMGQTDQSQRNLI